MFCRPFKPLVLHIGLWHILSGSGKKCLPAYSSCVVDYRLHRWQYMSFLFSDCNRTVQVQRDVVTLSSVTQQTEQSGFNGAYVTFRDVLCKWEEKALCINEKACPSPRPGMQLCRVCHGLLTLADHFDMSSTSFLFTLKRCGRKWLTVEGCPLQNNMEHKYCYIFCL